MTLEDRLSAAMSAIGSAVKALRDGKADDTAVLHRSGDETKTGTLTFGASPVVPAPSAPAHPVRRDDARFVPGGGTDGQVLTKASATDYALAWADPTGSGAGGSYLSGPVPAGAATVSITHNLGTRDVVVMVRETSSYAYVPIANDAPDEDTVRLQFAEPPTTGQYRYVLFAALGDPVPGPVAPTAHAPTHAAAGADPLSPGAIGAAEAGHTHPYASSDHTHPPVLRGPWTRTSGFTSSGAGPTNRRVGGSLTVGPLGYDWRPLASARLAVRADIEGPVPKLVLCLDDTTGEVFAEGVGQDTGRGWRDANNNWVDAGWVPINCSPVFHASVLSGVQSHTFYLLARPNVNHRGWVENNTSGDPHITVYAIPAE